LIFLIIYIYIYIYFKITSKLFKNNLLTNFGMVIRDNNGLVLTFMSKQLPQLYTPWRSGHWLLQ